MCGAIYIFEKNLKINIEANAMKMLSYLADCVSNSSCAVSVEKMGFRVVGGGRPKMTSRPFFTCFLQIIFADFELSWSEWRRNFCKNWQAGAFNNRIDPAKI